MCIFIEVTIFDSFSIHAGNSTDSDLGQMQGGSTDSDLGQWPDHVQQPMVTDHDREMQVPQNIREMEPWKRLMGLIQNVNKHSEFMKGSVLQTVACAFTIGLCLQFVFSLEQQNPEMQSDFWVVIHAFGQHPNKYVFY